MLSVTPAFQEIAAPVSLGEQTRAVRASYRFPDGVDVDIYSVRWRRGEVELSAGLAVAVASDPSMLWELARMHDATYTVNSLSSGPATPASVPAPVQMPGR